MQGPYEVLPFGAQQPYPSHPSAEAVGGSGWCRRARVKAGWAALAVGGDGGRSGCTLGRAHGTTVISVCEACGWV